MKDFENIKKLADYNNVLITDGSGNVIFYDVADLKVLKDLGLRPEEMIGKKVTTFYRDLPDEESTVMKTIKSGEAQWNVEQELITTVGNKVTSINSTFPIRHGETIIGAIEFSKRYFMKEDIHSLNKFSEHKIYRKNNTVYTIDDLITSNPKMQQVKEQIKKTSTTNSTVLLNGKTGTGKEIVAQAIHNLSERYTNPFISLNCSAIPENLMESTLFGTVKGSFTGAEDTPGLFEQAEGGTLFLDEINSLDIHLQVKLLKVIEEKQVRRVGGKKNIRLDIRLISATNEDPDYLVEQNRLREDLFYRLGVVQIDLPELTERKEDIEVLLEYYIRFYNDNMNMKIKHVQENVVNCFKAYSWPGNIREFRNAIETAYNHVTSTEITLDDIPKRIRNYEKKKQHSHFKSIQDMPLRDAVNVYEKQLIAEALKDENGVLSKAAKQLGISKQSLNYKIEKHHLR